MYGLLLDCIQKFLCERYGERYWTMIRRRAHLENQWFVTHEVYDDSIVCELVDAAAIELGEEPGTVMRMFGEYFAESIGHYGYARLLRVLGRDLRNFLNGLDDLHEYLRFSYPKMCPPSFFCENETEQGMLLHYTTKRRGFLQYVIGQLTTVGRIYGKDLDITLLSDEISESGVTHMVMELKFDNSELLRATHPSQDEKEFTIDSQMFLGIFPFCIFFDKDLVVWRVGVKLQEVLPDLIGMSLKDSFTIRKPLFDALSFQMICFHANSVFELISTSPIVRKKLSSRPGGGDGGDGSATNNMDMDMMYYKRNAPHLRLKGQMMALPNMDKLAFLCSPVMDSPEDLYESGIYVNDLSMHDSSRDIILAGSQKDPELNLALNQEKIRSAQLEDSIQQTDQLLFQMIPKPIADQLRNGETPLNTCKEFSSVSILFSDIVSFTPMCSRLHPMEVVCVLNAMYVAYDQLCELNHVYKVQTIGDGYMALCGAPLYTVHHAEYITDFAVAIIKATYKINDPSTGESLKIRVGIHSGNVVAGVVGSNVLRYDVFGDTVNVAARMEASGSPMRVHVSESTAELLIGTKYRLNERGYVEVKGKGRMKTFWINKGTEEDRDAPPLEDTPPSVASVSKGTKGDEDTHPLEDMPPSVAPVPTVSISTASPTILTSQTPSPPLLTPIPAPVVSPLPPPLTPVPSPSLNVSPSLPCFANVSPPRPCTSSPCTTLRPLSPKPNEWPEAMQRLQKFSSMALDRSVPLGGGGGGVARRYTAPPSQLSRDIKVLPTIVAASDTNNQLLPVISLSKLNTTLWNQQQLMAWPTSHSSTVTNLAPSQPDLTEEGDGDGDDSDELSGLHMLPSPSTSPGLASPILSHSLSEMECFALQAEDNAKRAKELSDWAANIVHTLKVEEANHTHKVTNHTHDFLPKLIEGTSVDPVVVCPMGQHKDYINDCPIEQHINACPIGQHINDRPVGQDNDSICTIM